MKEIKELGNIRISSARIFDLSLEQSDPTDGISRFIDNLLRFLRRFVQEITDGTAGLSIALGRLHNRADQIATESRSLGRLNRSDSFVINTRIKNLCVNFRAINDPQQLFTITKTSDQLFKSYFRYQTVELPALIPAIINIDPKSPDSVMRLLDILSPVCPINKASSLGLTGDNSSRSSAPLFGNLKFHAVSKYPTGNDVDNIAGQEWLISPVSDNPRPLPESIKFNVFAPTIEQSILRQVLSTLSGIESSFGIVSRNNRGSKIDSLIRYLENLRNRALSGSMDVESLDRADQMVKLLMAYNHWLVSPYLDMMSLYVNNTTALLNVCQANN